MFYASICIDAGYATLRVQLGGRVWYIEFRVLVFNLV